MSGSCGNSRSPRKDGLLVESGTVGVGDGDQRDQSFASVDPTLSSSCSAHLQPQLTRAQDRSIPSGVWAEGLGCINE